MQRRVLIYICMMRVAAHSWLEYMLVEDDKKSQAWINIVNSTPMVEET